MQGFYPEELPKNKFIICMDAQGFKSSRAVHFLKRKGYHAKILIGGIENLDGLMELKQGDFMWINFINNLFNEQAIENG